MLRLIDSGIKELGRVLDIAKTTTGAYINIGTTDSG